MPFYFTSVLNPLVNTTPCSDSHTCEYWRAVCKLWNNHWGQLGKEEMASPEPQEQTAVTLVRDLPIKTQLESNCRKHPRLTLGLHTHTQAHPWACLHRWQGDAEKKENQEVWTRAVSDNGLLDLRLFTFLVVMEVEIQIRNLSYLSQSQEGKSGCMGSKQTLAQPWLRRDRFGLQENAERWGVWSRLEMSQGLEADSRGSLCSWAVRMSPSAVAMTSVEVLPGCVVCVPLACGLISGHHGLEGWSTFGELANPWQPPWSHQELGFIWNEGRTASYIFVSSIYLGIHSIHQPCPIGSVEPFDIFS